MRGLLQFLWLGMVLIVVALLSALIAMRFAVHGREVSVPDLQGKSPAEARRLADDIGLAVEIEREYYSATIPSGKIVSQMPAAGSTVRRGWELRLALSLGPQRVTIPQLVGQSGRAATISLEDRGLEISSAAMLPLPGVPADTVVGQDPPANATDVSAPRVSLLIAQAPEPEAFVTPSFIGQPLGTVASILKEAGFSLGKATVATTAAPANPSAATAPGSAVAPAPASPSATNSTAQSPAAPTPSAPAPTSSPASIILSQDPAPGQKILAGAAMNFIVQ